MKPLISKQYTGRQLMNPGFKYVPSFATDVAETFAKIRAQMEQPVQQKKVRRVK